MAKMIKVSLLLMLLVLISTGCTTKAENSQMSNYVVGEVERIEIHHFHGTNQCYSCITVGEYAEETLKTHFADELKSGKIVFRHINGELPENQEIVVKYGATGSSLWIGTYTKDGQFIAEQNINVWYRINNKSSYLSYLKEVIDKRLSGDMS
jgi:hypothetical protein